MSPRERILVQAVAAPQDRAPIHRAVTQLAESLGADGRGAWPIECLFLDSFEALDDVRVPSILLTSLLPELDRQEEAWIDTERRLRERYGRLSRTAGLTVYVATIFRHIDEDHTPEQAARLRVRIRRLNLLAVELSREAGVIVIDLDRVLADLGGLALRTDYRLGGELALEAAALSIATTIASTGLDDWAPFEIQEAAIAHLAAKYADREMEAAPLTSDTGISVRSGRRYQRAQIVGRRENQVAFYLRQLASGKVSAREAAAKLAGAVSRRGFRNSAATVVAGFGRVLRPGAGEPRS